MMKLMMLAAFLSFAKSQSQTFTNPIIGGHSLNPCISKVGGYYYLLLEVPNLTELVIYKSPILTNFRNAEKKIVLSAPDGFRGMVPSEMLELNGGLYIYFTMNSAVGLRMYVMQAHNSSDPMGAWGDPIRLVNDWEVPGMDGTVMIHNELMYYVWTSLVEKETLYIAPMTSPTWVGNPKVKIREPHEAWECVEAGCVSEGAALLYGRNVTYLIYSTKGWGTPDYSLAQMSISVGSDPLIPDNWSNSNGPVFWRNDEEDLYGTGHAKFTLSPDGTENWMIYQAAVNPGNVHRKQSARLEKIDWNEDGSPRFPRPFGILHEKPLPSGQLLTCV